MDAVDFWLLRYETLHGFLVDDLTDQLCGGEVDDTGLLAGGGVEDGTRALGAALPGLAGDEVGDAGGGRAHGVSVLHERVEGISVSDARRIVESAAGRHLGNWIRAASGLGRPRRPPHPRPCRATVRSGSRHEFGLLARPSYP